HAGFGALHTRVPAAATPSQEEGGDAEDDEPPGHADAGPSPAATCSMAADSAGLTLWPSSRCAAATLLARVSTNRRYPSTSSAVALLSSSAVASRRCCSPVSL